MSIYADFDITGKPPTVIKNVQVLINNQNQIIEIEQLTRGVKKWIVTNGK